MRPFWELFHETKTAPLITFALIVNEQNYIERRTAHHPIYEKKIFNRLFFKSQSLLQFNSVVFPFIKDTRLDEDDVPVIGLVGRIVERFPNIKERIEIGKQLYALLFADADLHDRILSFAKQQNHTGSRADYWPNLFHTFKSMNSSNAERNKKKLDLLTSSLYSPTLRDAWVDQPIDPPETFDWFIDERPFRHFRPVRIPWKYEISGAHRRALQRLSLGAAIVT